MNKIILLLFSLLLIVTSCTNECQDLLDEVTTAKYNYENDSTQPNCIAYQSALESYLASSCQGQPGVNYTSIFNSYLSALNCNIVASCTNGIQDGSETGIDCGGPNCNPCDSTTGPTCTDGIQNGNETGIDCGGPNCNPCDTTTGPTCTDGIQNGNETGIDCGGICPPCSTNPNYYMSCEIDGAPWSGYIGGFIPLSVNSSGIITGYKNFLNEGQIRISNFDDFLTTGSYVFSIAGVGALSSGEASFSYSPEASGTINLHYYEPVGNNGTLTVTDVNLVDQTVTGTFSLTAYDNNFTPFDTINVTNGEFYLPFD